MVKGVSHGMLHLFDNLARAQVFAMSIKFGMCAGAIIYESEFCFGIEGFNY